MRPLDELLPIDDALAPLKNALAQFASAVLVAPATHFGASLYVNIGVMPGSAFAIARRYAGRSPMRSR